MGNFNQIAFCSDMFGCVYMYNSIFLHIQLWCTTLHMVSWDFLSVVFCITWTVKALYLEYNMQPCKIFLHWSYTCSSFCVSISMLAEILLIATNIIHGILKYDREQIFSPKSSDLKTERLEQVLNKSIFHCHLHNKNVYNTSIFFFYISNCFCQKCNC